MRTYLESEAARACLHYEQEREMRSKFPLAYIRALYGKITALAPHLTDDLCRWLEYIGKFIWLYEGEDESSLEESRQLYQQLLADERLNYPGKVYIIIAVQSLPALARQLENIIEMIETDHREFLKTPVDVLRNSGKIPQGWTFQE